LEDFPPLLGRQQFEGLTLLLRRQLWEMLLGVLAIEVLHRQRHGKALPSKLLEHLLLLAPWLARWSARLGRQPGQILPNLLCGQTGQALLRR
jgi:hypothetical protein